MASKGEELWKKYKSGGDSDITPSSSASTTSTKNNAVERWNKWKQDNSTLGSRVQESGSDLFDRYNHVIERASGLNQFYKNWRGTSDREKYRASYGDMEALKGELSSLLETDLTFLDRGQVQEMLDNVSIISDALSQYEEYYSQGETAEEFQYALEQKLPWYQRSDRLRDARNRMEASEGKSDYQILQEDIMAEDRRLAEKWQGSHQQIGSTYLTGSGGYNAPLNEHYNNVGQAYLEDRKDLDELLEEKHWIDYVQKYTGKEFEDDFFGQTSANYTMGRLSQDSSLAWNAYLENPTDANRRDAETIDQLMTEIQGNNQDVYADDGKLPWLSKTLANYIPQFLDQMKYSGSFGAAGALTGNAQGVKAGMVLGSGAYSYMTMRGAAFKSLLEAGIPEEQARAAAKDEAVVSSLIEMGDTAIDLATLGGGKLINVLSAGSVDAIKNQIAKGVGKNVLTKLAAALANYGINIGSEWLEEATQESVSIANQNNPDGGIPGLVQDAAGVFFGSVLDSKSEEGQQIREAGAEGAKIAVMMGGIQGITNAAARRIATNGKMAADQQEQRVPEQLPPEAQEQNQGDMLQQMPEQSPQESLQEEQEVETAVSDPEVPAVTLEDLSAKYGAQAGAMEQTYRIGGGDQDVAKFDRAYEMAYNMGKSGVNESYAMKSQATSYLTEDQRKFAFQAGQYAAETAAQDQVAKNASAANGNTGWKKGVVKGEGVQIADLTKTFNDPQRAAYRTLSTIAEATGIDIVLYQSQQNQDGRFEGSQGKFKWNENAIYIDVNAGLSYAKDVGELSKYTMLRTFDHEFTHFVEKWNPQQYNELRKTVFDTLTEQGVNVEDLIDLKMAQDSTGKLTYDLASREVVAEAMTDILPDSSFVETLAKKNRTLFETFLSKFKEFLSNVKSYFASLAQNPSKEARALQKQMGDTVSYLENIVKMFDQAAVKAVEQYQSSVAEEVKQDKKSDEKPVSKPKSAESTEKKPEAKEEKQDAKTSQPAANKEEQAPKPVQEQEYQDDNGFTVRTNSQYGTLEISFTSKPDAAIRDVLKVNKFRWNGKKGVWYGKADQQTIVDALRGAYEKLKQEPIQEEKSVEPAVKEEPSVKEAAPSEEQEAQQVEMPGVEQETAVETSEMEQPEPESIPAQSETEEAKQELRKAVRMPIQGTNMEALLQGIKSRELSMESITLRGTVPGFNEEQRTHLVEKLIEGVYSNKNSIKIDVPYDGKFEIVNSPESVAKVLDELKVRVNQEVLLDKKALSLLTSRNDIRYTTIGDQLYLSNGAIMIPSSSAAVEYAKEHYNAKDGTISQKVLSQMEKPGTRVTKAPTEAVTDKKLTVYIFDIDGQKQYFDKRYISYFDGNYFYAIGTDPRFPLLRAEDSNGEVRGFVAGVHTDESKVQGEKPSKLKSFSNPKAPTLERRKPNAAVKTGNGMDQVAKKADKMPSMDLADGASTVESSVKLEDFGEKIGGARKDLWNSRGLLVDDLSVMNDRERSKAVKKDNVWKRPDYRKLVEVGESRGILYARNEIRKALNQNITYPYVTGDGAKSTQYLEQVRKLQEDFISTVRDIQGLTEKAKTAEDFWNMGRPWLREQGFLTEVNGKDQYTDKWRKNPALKATDYVVTVEYLARNFDRLEALAEKKGFAADVKTQVPKGYTIHQDSQEDGTWFVAKGHYILRHHFPSYDDALTFLKQLTETKKRKTRFVPQQLLEVHRKGPDYRNSKNVSGQDYLDTFGFRGGEFGNWLNEKDRQVSLNYGFDALKDLADALQIADTDISLDGNLSIAFGARGQGLSGAAAHYEPARHVINLTKMKGAGSLAHEWFHALDDFVGGYQEKMATDNQRNLPETTKEAVRNLITAMQYRDATQEETDLAATKRYEQARRSVTFQVNEMFPWVEKLENGRLLEHETKYFNRKPTAEDAKRYHDLLNRLLDTGDAAVVDELSEFRKAVYGRVIPKENREAIGYRLFPLKPDAGKNVQKMRQYTNFYINSRRFNDLYQKDGDYWDSTVEMAARAFACYVADKTGASNDYLSAHSDSAVGFDVEKNGDLKVIKAFPEGQERTEINAAFDQLIAALKDDGFLHEQEETEKPGMIQYQSRRYLKDHNEPDSAREWSAFNRSFANKTNGLKPGETTNITIYTADNVYFVEATGYMEGTIVRKMSLNENIALVDAFMEEFKNGTELGTKGNHQPDAFSKGNHGGYSGDYASVTGTEAAGGNAVLAGAESAGDNVRDYWESLGFNSEEELIEAVKSGALVMDENGDLVTFEQYQPRTRSLTDQEILEIAADDLRLDELTEGERDALQIFRDRITRLNDLQEQRADLGTQYREQQFGANGQKADRAEAEKTRERMKILDSQIAKAQAGILDVQNKAVLRKVLQKARKVVETKQREKDAVVLSRWRDRRNNAEEIQKYRKRISKDVKAMTDWVINPSNKDVVKHIPDALKNTVIPFLSSIDFTSKRQLRGGNATKADAEFIKRLDILKSAMRNRMNDDNTGMYSGYTDLPPDFMERLDSFVDSAKAITGDGDGEFIINRMTASELRELSSIVKSLKKLVQDFNRFHANAMYQHVYDAANATIQELAVYHDAPSRTKVGESVNNFLFWEQIRPAYAFERFGKGGVAIYDGLRRGQAQLAFDTKEIVDFSEKAYTEQEVREWDKEVKEIHLGATVVRMKVSQIMSLYALSKRKQAFGHIVGNGIRVSTFFDKGKKVSDTGHKLAPQQIGQIIGVLTPRQIEVADQLQKFMQNKGGQWGNYVSLKRFGENLFGEPNYFPINSDGRHLEATADENPSAASLYALLNMGFTKKTVEKAKNRIVIYSIFDVFANHMASMAQYHSMALPVLDALKWFNYNQDGSVRDELNRVFGAPEESRPGSGKRGYAENFVIGILKAFNGTEAQGVPSDTRGMNALRRFNMAQVAYNARVVVQQPLAVTRAAMLLDYASIAKGMKLSASAIQKNIQEMNKYSGIAAWKSLGFYDTNISRGLTSIIKHDETIMDKISEVGMIGAEKADQITWAGIWSACKEEIRRKKPDIEAGSDAYFQAVTDLFEDVVYKTQVVDSVLTKNEFLRSKGLFARLTGSFMSEPTTTASMVLDAFDKYRMDLQLGMSKQVAWERNRKNIVRTVYVYAVGAVALAAVQAVADAFRDDDDYATFLEKWLDAFGGNLTDELMPFNKLPLLSDFYELAKELAGIFGLDTYGNPPQSVYMQWYDSLVKGFEILYQKITGEDTNYTWYAGAYKMLQALSGIVGIPMAATTREIVTAWNSTIGTMAPSLKVKTYDSGDMNNIKYAYLDGYLTDAEATQELMSKGLVDNENEAYWKIREWDADGEYSRYDSLYQAARNGQSIQQAMEEFTSHGYTEKEVLSKLKSQIGIWYEAGEISKQQAVDMLEKYMDMDSQSIDATVNKWSSKVVTGIAFEDIKEEFLSGNLTASRAAEMYVRYGGYTEEDAQATVKGWQFEQEWGFAYSQRKSAYKSGQITDSELRTILMDMGGKTAEEAEQDIAVYDWEMEVPGSDGISYAAIRDYYESVEPYGVTKGTYTKAWKIKNSAKGVDADGDGKKDAYSVVKEVFPQIAALPISSEQKDALAHCWWSDSTVRKYKTW